MTKLDLRQYRSLKREVQELTDEINKSKTHDVVKTSSQNYPYIQGVAHVEGIPLTREVKRLHQRKQRCIAEIQKIRDIVDSIEDSELRRIIKYRYIVGLRVVSWRAVAFQMGIDGDGSTERKKVKRFLEVSPFSPKTEVQ